MFELNGRRALVTGAASGIGLAIAELFAAQGAQVALIDLNQQKAVEAAAKIGPQASGFACDVSDEASVQAAFASIGGPVDILRQLRRHRARR